MTCYLTTDMLGSTRLVTDENGVAKARFDYYPFGGAIMASGSTGRGGVLCGSVSCYPQDVVTPPAVSQQFTGMEHDFETGMDYFYARYYSGAEGRFTGADLPLNDQYPSDPQSWNLYGYVRNSPLIYTDPDGRTCTYRTGPDGRIIADCVDDGPAPGGLTAGEQLCRMLGGCGGSTGGGGRSGPNTPAPASTQPKPDTLKLQNTDTESADSCELPSWLPDWLPPLVLAVDLPILPGLNFANNFALAQGRFYYGPGLAVGSWGVNFGPMVHGNVENAPEVIKGWGWSSNIQLSPGIGYQGIWNSSGAVGGPAVGMPGGSIGYGYNFERYSFCK